MATSQQAAGLHPFVSKIKLVEQSMFPEISLTSLTTDEWTTPVIADDFNIYTTKVTTDTVNLTKTLSIIKLQRQNFHENYFTANIATTPSVGAYGLTPVTIQINSIEDCNAELSINKISTVTYMYLYYKSNIDYHLVAYEINNSTGGHDLIPIFNLRNIATLVNKDLHGVFYNVTKIFMYYAVGTLVTIKEYNRSSGDPVTSFQFELDQIYSYCKIKMARSNENTFYVTVKEGNVIKMATYSLAERSLSGFFNMINNIGGTPVNPGFISFARENGVDMCSLVYGFNNDTNNILQIAYIPNTVSSTTGYITGLETPFYYNINKYELFSEVSKTSQMDMVIAVTTNPNNANFVYMAYVTGTSQLRMIKLYRNNIAGTYETSVPLVMWATRLGAIGDTFQGNMGIVTDSTGSVYIITHDSVSSQINIWKTKEYIMDLGHTEGAVVAPVDTITNMLQTMTNDYTILTLDQNIHIAGLPQVNDVTIDTITTEGNNLSLQFQYINYDLLQGFPMVVNDIRTLVNNTFSTLYEDSGISVVNLDPTAPSIDGDDTSISVFLPLGSAKKPCVVKGTEIVRMNQNTKPQRIPVEHIQIGDYVLNQACIAVRVIDHMKTTVYAEPHNAPYLIPKNFFGQNRPYKNLLISGDHGILISNNPLKVVYPEDITVLSKVLLNVTIEFHHLLLENHQENFYIANGLEVDSYHPGLFMKRK